VNYFDIFLCVIIAFFAIRSTLRGAIREIFSLLALITGVIISCRYYAPAADLLIPHINNPLARTILAFSGIFLLVYIAINIAGWLIAKFIKFIRLSPLDRFAGFFVGIAKGYLIVCFLIIMLLVLAPPGSKLLKESRVTLQSIPFIEKLSVIFPASMKTILEEKTRELKKTPLPKFSI
jgi:membrane protein required for colicin V production